MNEETLNNTTTLRGDQHIGGYVLLERVDSHRWRAYGWSAFFARMVLSLDSTRSFRDADGNAVTELSDYNNLQLDDRLEVAEKHTSDRMVFTIPPSMVISESIFERWKNNLPTESKLESNELQSIFRR